MKKKVLALLAFTGASLGICVCLNHFKNSKDNADKEKEESVAEDESEEIVDSAE